MPITTLGVAAAVTPSVIETYFSHYLNRAPLRHKPTAHISYHEGLRLIRQFLDYAAKHKVEDIQAFTGQWIPAPTWVRIQDNEIEAHFLNRAAEVLQDQLGRRGLERVGGKTWWQWRRPEAPLKAEWIEMKKDYNERKRAGQKSDRVLLYIHGGAYYFGSVDEHRYQMQRHARKLKARCLAPRYRLAPQFPFPCGLQDCIATYLFLLGLFPPEQILLGGDSAGGGMTISLLVTLRDQGIPLPAGAILLSPWVDLTHSFPSVAGKGEYDYIPAHGFMHRPSIAWPPPPHDAVKAAEGPAGAMTEPPPSRDPRAAGIPGIGSNLSIDLDGEKVELKEQIQMYAPNELLSFPLVSPVMQPSLGGLPPLLIQTGGGELLHDEQVYLAHKAANPQAYPPSDAVLDEYDPKREIINRYAPTDVQLQVWDDLCHVPHTLSFTRPAKYMYRSVAQFGAWALAHAQNKSVEIREDDVASVISEEDSESEEDAKKDLAELRKKQDGDAVRTSFEKQGAVGKAGDPLPSFHRHMIRQRVDRHGVFYNLAPTADLPCLHLDPNSIGQIKPGPVRKWLRAKKANDTKFASAKKKVQQERAKELALGYDEIVGEVPPPTALVNRRRKGVAPEEKKRGKGWGLAMWSGWGSRHDEDAMAREEEMEKDGNPGATTATGAAKPGDQVVQPAAENAPPSNANSLRPDKSRRTSRYSRSQRSHSGSRPMSPYRSVVDAGQAGERGETGTFLTPEASMLARHASTTAPIPVATQDPVVPTTAVIAPDSAPVPGTENTYLNPANNRPHNGVAAYPFRLKNPNGNPSTLTLDSQMAESTMSDRRPEKTAPTELPAASSTPQRSQPVSRASSLAQTPATSQPTSTYQPTSASQPAATYQPSTAYNGSDQVFNNSSSMLGSLGPDGMPNGPAVKVPSQPTKEKTEDSSSADSPQDGKLPFKLRNPVYDSRADNRPPSMTGPSPVSESSGQKDLPFKLRHTIYDPRHASYAAEEAPPRPPPKDELFNAHRNTFS